MRGFTLIEMCLVVTLLGVMVSIAWPSFQGLHERMSLERATQDLSDCFAYARSTAVATQGRYEVAFNRDPWSYTLERVATSDDGSQATREPAAGRWGAVHRLPDNISVELPPDPIEFFPNGSSTSGRLQLKLGDREPVTFELAGAFGYAQIK